MYYPEKFPSSIRSPLLLIIVFLLCIIISACASAQVSNDYILKLKPVFVKQYEEETPLMQKSCRLKMDFNSAVILNPEGVKILEGKTILKIELVYSAFQVSDEFKQPELNKERIAALRKLAPFLFRSTSVEWKVIGQKGCGNEYEAKKLFHGFVITYRPDATSSSVEKEIKGLTKITDNDSLGKDSFVVVTKMRMKRRSTFLGYSPVLKGKRKEGILYSSRGFWNRKAKYRVWYDTIITKDSVSLFVVNKNAMKYLSKAYSGFEWSGTGPDTVISAVLNRNKQWKNILFVCDVTGSMSPYSAQLLVWNKLNFNGRRAKFFTFFNDGDDKMDMLKRIGHTGGIYHVKANAVEEVEEKARTAMANGSGGDSPENDIEALLDAIEKCPDASEIVLIADNWAPIKDIELLCKIKKPVHVILCGVYGGALNTDYLDLALRTKGSIHTMEQDLTDLVKLNEGQKIKIGKQTYQIKNGKFVLMYEL